jgi:hypothetical protein
MEKVNKKTMFYNREDNELFEGYFAKATGNICGEMRISTEQAELLLMNSSENKPIRLSDVDIWLE